MCLVCATGSLCVLQNASDAVNSEVYVIYFMVTTNVLLMACINKVSFIEFR